MAGPATAVPTTGASNLASSQAPVARPSGPLAWPTAFDVELRQGTYLSSPPFAVPFTIEVAEPGWFSGHLHAEFIDLLRFDGVVHTGLPTLMLAFASPAHYLGPDGRVAVGGLSPESAATMTAALEGLTVTNRAPVELLGLAGVRIDVRAVAPDTHVFGGPGGNFGASPEQPFRMAILARGEELLLVLVLAEEGADDDDLSVAWDRAQGVLRSVRFT